MGNRQRRRRIALVGIAALATLAVTACAPGARETIPSFPQPGGQTAAGAAAMLEQIPGITVERLTISQAPNAKHSTSAELALALDAGYTIADADACVDLLARAAWSVRDAYQPTSRLYLSVAANDANTFDLGEAAVASGWLDTARAFDGGTSRATIVLSSPAQSDLGARNRARLGAWPTVSSSLTHRIDRAAVTPGGGAPAAGTTQEK